MPMTVADVVILLLLAFVVFDVVYVVVRIVV